MKQFICFDFKSMKFYKYLPETVFKIYKRIVFRRIFGWVILEILEWTLFVFHNYILISYFDIPIFSENIH